MYYRIHRNSHIPFSIHIKSQFHKDIKITKDYPPGGPLEPGLDKSLS